MSNIVIFGPTQSGKTTLLGYLATSMLRDPQFNEEVLQNLKFIRKLTIGDDFSIGNPYNPVNVNKDVILPSFVSLDKDELRKFKGANEKSEGSTKRIHRKQLTICTSERDDIKNIQNENENVSCIFVDTPGFRQRLTDKYAGFFEGDVGIAVLKLTELVEFYNLLNATPSSDDMNRIDYYENRLFEPIRIWCDYRSPSNLMIVISQIDHNMGKGSNIEDNIKQQIYDINNAVKCINTNITRYNRGINIPITPISIKVISEPNIKKHHRMAVFFHRQAENIYRKPEDKTLPGDGTFISCLKKIMPPTETEQNRAFSMASVYQVMKTIVGNSSKTALNVHALHGTIHKSDTIKLGPFIEKMYNEIAFAKCSISSIKADSANKPSEMLLEGNTGGLIFKSIKNIDTGEEYDLSYISNKSDISILKSTILFNGDIQQGNIIELEINRSDYLTVYNYLDEIYSRVLCSIMPFDQIFLFWYGKKIAVNIVEIAFLDDKMKLSAIVSKNEHNSLQQFALPCDETGEIIHQDNVLLAIPRVFYSSMPKKLIQDKYTYVSTSISKVKNSSEFDLIKIKAKSNIDWATFFNNSVHYEQSDASSTSVTVPINVQGKNIDIYSVLTKIGRNIKYYYSRQDYRNEGMECILLKNELQYEI